MARVALCLAGNFGNRYDPDAGLEGFEHLKQQVLNRHSTDVFIFSRDLDHQEMIEKLWGPWTVVAEFEDPATFSSVFQSSSLSGLSLTGPDPSRTLFSHAAMFYGRDKALGMCLDYASREN